MDEEKLTPEQQKEMAEKSAKGAKINLSDAGLKAAYAPQLIKNSKYAGIFGGITEQKYLEALGDEAKYKSISEKIIQPTLQAGKPVYNQYIQESSFAILMESLGNLKISDLVKYAGGEGKVKPELNNIYVKQLGEDAQKLISIALSYQMGEIAKEMIGEEQKGASKTLEELVGFKEEDKSKERQLNPEVAQAA